MSIKDTLAVMAVSISLGLSFIGCTDDEKKVGSAVDSSQQQNPASPPANAFETQTVYFDFDRSDIKSEGQASLNSLAEHLKASTVHVQIEGHTDERGTIEYNLALGERRAQAVKGYLGQLGVDTSRLTTISYGEEKPAVEGVHNETAWAKNRRAEFTMSN